MIKHVVFDHDGTLVNMQGGRVLFEGVKKLLVELQSKGVKLYVWTARDRYSCVDTLKSLDIIGFFEDISTATDCQPKPYPDGLNYMLDGVDPIQVMMVGDSYTDMVGGKKFGATTVGVIWDYPSERAREVLIDKGADHICKTVQECRDLILSKI